MRLGLSIDLVAWERARVEDSRRGKRSGKVLPPWTHVPFFKLSLVAH